MINWKETINNHIGKELDGIVSCENVMKHELEVFVMLEHEVQDKIFDIVNIGVKFEVVEKL